MSVASANCRECGSALREGARFCTSCGMKQEVETTQVAAPTPSATAPETAKGSAFLLPALPFRLLWSPRKPWRLKTTLPDSEVAQVFEATMTKEPGFLRRMNSYFGNVRWQVQRNTISGALTATCRQTGPVTVGIGRNKRYVDVDGNTIECIVDPPAPSGPGEVVVGPNVHTTFLGLYLYPALTYPVNVIKALRRADPNAEVRHPWSIFRIAVVTLIAVSALVGVVGESISTDSRTGAAAGDFAPQSSQPTSSAGEGDDTDFDVAPASDFPDVSDPAVLDEIRTTLLAFHRAVGASDFSSAWGLLTPRKRAQIRQRDGYPTWRSAQATLTGYLDPDGLDVTAEASDPISGVARVRVTGMRWLKPGAGCTHWNGLTWVKYERGAWLYDPGYSTTSRRRRTWEHRNDELLGATC